MAGNLAYAAAAAGSVWRQSRMVANRWIEFRRSERRLTFKTGRVVAANGSLECAILNVSEHGACILLPAGSLVGDQFALLIDGEPAPHYCVVAWRDGARLGVSYDLGIV